MKMRAVHMPTQPDLELQLDVMSGVLQNASGTSGPGDAVIKANEEAVTERISDWRRKCRDNNFY